MPFASFTLENDFFAGYDRHYTNGVQIAFVTDAASAPAALRALPPLRWSADPQVVVAVGQRIYTPTDTWRAPPDPADRPYAGWLYLLADVRTRDGDVVDHITVTVGTVGPAALGRQSQRIIHRLLDERPSEGWDSQLRNEATAMVGFERAWPALATTNVLGGKFDTSLRAGATFGTPFTYASAGAVVRYGRNLPVDLPATHISLGPSRDGFRGTSSFGWYAWAGIDARAVARNVFIDGNTFRDSASVKREPFGFDAQLGIAATWPRARIGFTYVHRSKEFEGQGSGDRFGQLAISFAY